MKIKGERTLKRCYVVYPMGAGGRSTGGVFHPDMGLRPGDKVQYSVLPDGSHRIRKVPPPRRP